MSSETITTKKAEDGFEWFVETIEEDETASDRVTTYQIIQEKPTRDKRMLPYLEAALEDREVALLMIPYAYGEIRIAAAYALQAERQALGITEPVVLRQVPRPLASATGFNLPMLQARENPEAMQALKQAEKLHPGGHPGLIARYKVLREYNLIPLFDLELKTTPDVKYLFIAGTPLGG